MESEYVCTCGPDEYCAADDCHGATGEARSAASSSREVESANDRYAIEHPHGDWHVASAATSLRDTINAVLRVAQLDADNESDEFPTYEDFDEALNALDALAATTASRADAVREHYTKVCRCEWSEDEFTRTTTSEGCSIHGSVPDPLDALVAENERLRRDRMNQVGQMDYFEGRLAYARYLRHAHPEGLEGYLALFDAEERARLEAELANEATVEDA